MQTIIAIVSMVAAISCLSVNALIAYMLWQHWYEKKTENFAKLEETPEEQEARRLAAEVQAAYEQGFVNLMNYDGMPIKGE